MTDQRSLAPPLACATIGITCGVLANVYRDSRLGLLFFLLGLAAVIAWFPLYRKAK